MIGKNTDGSAGYIEDTLKTQLAPQQKDTTV